MCRGTTTEAPWKEVACLKVRRLFSSSDLFVRAYTRLTVVLSFLQGAHSRTIYSLSWTATNSLAASSNGVGRLASAGGDGRICIWQVVSDRFILSPPPCDMKGHSVALISLPVMSPHYRPPIPTRPPRWSSLLSRRTRTVYRTSTASSGVLRGRAPSARDLRWSACLRARATTGSSRSGARQINHHLPVHLLAS